MKLRGSIFYLSFLVTSCSLRPFHSEPPVKEMKQEKYYQEFNGIKKRMVLLTFYNESPEGGEDLGVTATEELRRELLRTGRFVIENFPSNIFGNSKKIYAGGGSDLFQLSRKAKKMGVNMIVFGRIMAARTKNRTDEIGLVRKSNTYTDSKVEIRIYDTHAGKEVFKDIVKGYASDSKYQFFVTNPKKQMHHRREILRYGIQVAVRRSVPEIIRVASSLDWVGRVAKVIGNKIYISAGRKSGINIKDILQVVTKGEEIFDQDTGALIGISRGEVKGTVEVIDYFGVDGTIAILHSGGSVTQGDFVQLY